eukprot:2347336-Rhodomonas_salina.2
MVKRYRPPSQNVKHTKVKVKQVKSPKQSTANSNKPSKPNVKSQKSKVKSQRHLVREVLVNLAELLGPGSSIRYLSTAHRVPV